MFRQSPYLAALGVIVTGVIFTGGSLGLMAPPAHADMAAAPHLAYPLVSASQVHGAASQVHGAADVVAAEDLRLGEIQRNGPGLARTPGGTLVGSSSPNTYTQDNAAGDTLVLTARPTAYVLADLLSVAPRAFTRMKDGSYLFSEHLAVMTGATLRLSAPGGLTVRLASGPRGFASIVALGGRLELVGRKDAPVSLSSWDVDAGAPDTATYDGRAYLRTIDGTMTADHVDASALGFWSGRTGGLALTGSALAQPGVPAHSGRSGTSGSDSWGLFTVGDAKKPAAGTRQPGPAGPNLKRNVPAPALVSYRITNTSITGNAFGLFISGTSGISVSDTTVKDSLFAGVVLHRYVTKGVLSRTSSNNNAGDGFLVDRATTGITLNQASADDNAGSGFIVSGVPEADGPSVAGESTSSYGNNVISNSTANGNGRYGMHIVGGATVRVHNNRVTDSDVGIAVTGPAEGVSIIDNEIADAPRQGIALVDGVRLSTVTGNSVDGTGTGIYLRDSAGQVNGNTIQRAAAHGVSLVGQVAGSDVAGNVLAGSGASALDVARSSGAVASSGNQVGGWHKYTSPGYFWFNKMLQPLTLLWVMIAMLLLLSLARNRLSLAHARKEDLVVHPYTHQITPQFPTDGGSTTLEPTGEPSRSSS